MTRLLTFDTGKKCDTGVNRQHRILAMTVFCLDDLSLLCHANTIGIQVNTISRSVSSTL